MVSAEHPFAGRDSIELAELQGQPLAIPDATYGVRQALELAAKKRGVSFTPVFTTSSLETQKSLARLGSAVLILPQVDADARDLGDGLVAVPIADDDLGRVTTSGALSLPWARHNMNNKYIPEVFHEGF